MPIERNVIIKKDVDNMVQTQKCLEYYFDSRKYSKIDVMNCIQKEKLEYPDKEINMQLHLNEWGIYVIKAQFIDKKEQKEREYRRKKEIQQAKREVEQAQKKEKLEKKVLEQKPIKTKKQKIKERKMNQIIKMQKREQEKPKEKEKPKYGQYKSTGTYRPY